MEFLFFLFPVGAIGLLVLIGFLHQRRLMWRGSKPHGQPVIHMDLRMAVRPTILGHSVPDGARLTALVLGTGVIDRTGTARHGVHVKVLDPIPARIQDPGPLDALMQERAVALVREARNTKRRLRLLWSGGVDSTAACVALMRACESTPKLLEIAYTRDSIAEYRDFHRQQVKKWKGKRLFFHGKVSKALAGDDVMIITGEHGDQLFGSMLALDQPPERLFGPPDAGLQSFLEERLSSPDRVQAVRAWLAPVQAACPVPLPTFFDLLWWLNFALKWQPVSLRLLPQVQPKHMGTLEARLRHFYRTDSFQQWALSNPDKRIDPTGSIAPLWASYKWPLKAYIRQHTGDQAYFESKEKVPSLQTVMSGRPQALALDEGRTLFLQKPDYSLRPAMAAAAAATATTTPAMANSHGGGFELELELWDTLQSSDGDRGG